jgi:hypothetical protein
VRIERGSVQRLRGAGLGVQVSEALVERFRIR